MKLYVTFTLLCVMLLILVARQYVAPRSHAEPTPTPPPSQSVAPVNSTPNATDDPVASAGPPSSAEITLAPPLDAAQHAVPVADMPLADELAAPSDAPAESAAPAVVRWLDDAADDRAAVERLNELRLILLEDPSNEAALRAALRLARQHAWPNEACDLLARLVQLRPDDPELRYQLGTQYMLLRRWVEAIPHLRAAAEARPEHLESIYNLAVAHQALGHLEAAGRAWTRAIELDADNPDPYVHRGEVHLDLKDWASAAADFEQARRLESDQPDVILNLSHALVRLDRTEQARELLLSALAEYPRNVPLLNRLADTTWRLYEFGTRDKLRLALEIREYCERSLALVPDQPEIAELLERAREAERRELEDLSNAKG